MYLFYIFIYCSLYLQYTYIYKYKGTYIPQGCHDLLDPKFFRLATSKDAFSRGVRTSQQRFDATVGDAQQCFAQCLPMSSQKQHKSLQFHIIPYYFLIT